MQTFAIRISHDVAQAYRDAMAMTFKDFQENAQFTDLDLYCYGGRRVSVHRAVLLKCSPKLASLLGRQTCCFCHGVECDGKPDPFAISVPDFDVSTVFSLLDLLYTGRAYFASVQEYEDVLDLKDCLGLNLTPSALSLESSGSDGAEVEIDADSGLTSFFRKNLRRAEQLPDQEFILPSREARKRRGGDDPDDEDATESEEETSAPHPKIMRENRQALDDGEDHEPILDGQGKRMCPKCRKWYNARIWFDRHYRDCQATTLHSTASPSTAQVTNAVQVTPTSPNIGQVSEDERVCPLCNARVTTKGGWYTRHFRTCQTKFRSGEDVQPMATNTEPQQSTSSSQPQPSVSSAGPSTSASLGQNVDLSQLPEYDELNRVVCRNCGQYFAKVGGWHTKHVLYCAGENAKNRQVFDKSELTCPKCGKEYSPHCRRFVEEHVKKCDGTPHVPTAPISSTPSKTAATSPSANKTSTTPQVSRADPVLSCKFCNGSFNVGEFQNHLTVCMRSHGGGQQQQQQRDDQFGERSGTSNANSVEPVIALDQAKEMYERDEFNCYICGNKYSKRDIFKNHLVTHFRTKLQSLKPEVMNTLNCDACDYDSKEKNLMFVHIGLKHRLLQQFLPEILHEVLFKQQPQHASTSFSGWTCPVCESEFQTKNPIRNHMVKHFRAEIKERFINKDDPTQCPICTHKSDNSDHMIVHLAWTHQKLRDFLSSVEGDRLFNSSGHVRRHESTVQKAPEATGSATATGAFTSDGASTSAGGSTATTTPLVNQDMDEDVVQNSKPSYDCYICQKVIKRRHELKQHIFTHFRSQLQEKYFGQGPAKICPICKTYKSNSTEHVLIHIGLTHQKMCDFMREDVSDLIFGSSRKDESVIEEDSKKDNACFRCDGDFSTKEELNAHLEQCTWRCSNCAKVFRDGNAIKKHRELCQPNSGNAKSLFSCHICEIEYETIHHINGHYAVHYKDQLRARVANETPAFTGFFICSTCNHRTPSRESLATHIGAKHAQFVEFMPPEAAKAYQEFAQIKNSGKKSSGNASETNGDSLRFLRPPSNGENEKFSCDNCLTEFEAHHQLASHMTNVKCTRKSSRQSSGGPVRCKVCQEEVGSFLQYKCHLLVHYEQKLNQDWASKYEADSGKCLECGGSDNIVPGAEMGEEGKSSFVRHMALDHDKIFDYLDRDIRRHMRTAFDDGSIALPPTPPPPSTSADEHKTTADSLVHDNDIEPNDDSDEEIHIQIEAVEDVINPEIMEVEEQTDAN